MTKTKTKNPLRLALEDTLGSAGFSRKGDSWFRRTDEVVEVVNLQKSQYGHQYYLNYALWLRALGEVNFPREEKCHIRMRAGSIVSSDAELVRLLNFESGANDLERRSGFASILTSEFLPFAASCRSLRDLQRLYEAGKFTGAMVLGTAKRLLADSSQPVVRPEEPGVCN